MWVTESIYTGTSFEDDKIQDTVTVTETKDGHEWKILYNSGTLCAAIAC
jgi:hypothetical protein